MHEIIVRLIVAAFMSIAVGGLAYFVLSFKSLHLIHRSYIEPDSESVSESVSTDYLMKEIVSPNPGFLFTWSEMSNIDTGIKYYPRWICYGATDDSRLTLSMQKIFFSTFGNDLTGSILYPVSSQAKEFLEEMREEIRHHNGDIHPDNQSIPIKNFPNRYDKVILFDLALNTGETMNDVITFFRHLEVPIFEIWVYLLNDLVPASQRVLDEDWLNLAGGSNKQLRNYNGMKLFTLASEGIKGPQSIRPIRVYEVLSNNAHIFHQINLPSGDDSIKAIETINEWGRKNILPVFE